MKPNQILNSLAKITTGYAVFEKDQVLTFDQLNSIADYFNDETRLTRVKLLGVGIVCGLRVSVQENRITVTKGAGVTTEGDLLHLGTDTVFDRFKVYDESNPVYGPFYPEEKRITAYELVPEGKEDPRSAALSQFPPRPGPALKDVAVTNPTAILMTTAVRRGPALTDMVAVLFMESYVKDEDLCSGTDCDNLGKDFINTVKVLLVDRSSALLGKTTPTPGDAFAKLTEIVAERPAFAGSFTPPVTEVHLASSFVAERPAFAGSFTPPVAEVQLASSFVAERPEFAGSFTKPAQLAVAYRAACTGIHQKLLTELAKIYQNCSGFLGEVFTSDPADGWKRRLDEIRRTFDADLGIQYYYDFLKDVVETYNAFRNLLFGEHTWCCPDTDRFPKHLLLGNVSPGTDPEQNRTRFYPSPGTSRTSEALAHAKFLAGKIDTLIQTFALPASAPETAIRITPSSTEERCLEERAIPYYYAVKDPHPIQQRWNRALSQRGMGAWNYSYNAGLYNPQGGAASPLTSQIGRFSFFRIEGHLNQNVSAVETAIENQIKAHNLPFVVRSVFLGADKTKVVKKPVGRYSDLHRFHYLLRQDTFHQLDDVTKFSGKFKGQVDAAIQAKTVTDSSDDNDGVAVSEVASEKHATVTDKASSARGKLNHGYSAYKADISWKTDVGDTMKAAGEFKWNLGKVVKTEFTTPFDSLISNTHILWLDWLDDIIKQRDDRADEKLLFGKFVEENPGIEHFAGVPRGGTFVLVYDASNKVVADFMLDYRSVEEAEPEPEEPPLVKPVWKPNWVVDNGIKINPSIDKVLTGRLAVFKKDVVDSGKAVQMEYLSTFKDVANIFVAKPAITTVEK